MRRFDFEFDTSVAGLSGKTFRMLVVVYDLGELEILNLNTGIPVNLSGLPIKDQVVIQNIISQRFAEAA